MNPYQSPRGLERVTIADQLLVLLCYVLHGVKLSLFALAAVIWLAGLAVCYPIVVVLRAGEPLEATEFLGLVAWGYAAALLLPWIVG